MGADRRGGGVSALAPYERLVDLAEREASLVGSEAWDDLAALSGERQAVLAALPHTPPREAGPILERLAGCQALVTAALATARAAAAAELQTLGRGRGAVRGYASSTVQGAPGLARLDDAA